MLRATIRTLHCTAAVLAFDVASTAPAPGRVTLAGGKARLFKNGNPLVFGGAVKHVEPKHVEAGAVVDVVDGSDKLVGWGVYNPHSMYRVRLLASDEPALLEHRDLGRLLSHRIAAASMVRTAAGLPSAETTAYRLINGEGDRLSGLMVDIFDGTAVVISSALWLERNRDAISDALLTLPAVSHVEWRRSEARLKKDGWEEEEEAAEDERGEANVAAGEPATEGGDGALRVLENGLQYHVDILGQKSGFYCDQRDNRRHLAELCVGRSVLDLFCYSGGFSLCAGRAGAARCLGVDSSAAAVELASQNAALNGLDGVCEFVRTDVMKHLKEDAPAGGYDVVICDPPKLAPTVKDLPRATNRYRKLNGLAMRAVRPGGLLLSCTCSGAMTQSGTFEQTLQDAALAQGRALTLLRRSNAACDHTIHPSYPEGQYLTAVLAVVH